MNFNFLNLENSGNSENFENFRPEEECNRIVNFIRKAMTQYNFKGAVLGVSGGIDSAVVLALLLRALDKDRLKILILPERDSSKRSVEDAKLVCNHFGVNYEIFNVSGALRKLRAYSLFPPAVFVPESLKVLYSKNRWKRYKDPYLLDLKNDGDDLFLKGLAYYRAKHRVRMCKFYLEAEKLGYCVVGTTNKTELAVGLYVKWGDDSVDIEPIKHLYKTQVFELAKYLKVPERIIKKKPTPDLVPGINDEDAFKLDYKTIDEILIDLSKGKERNDENALRVKEIVKMAKMRELKSIGLEDAENFLQ